MFPNNDPKGNETMSPVAPKESKVGFLHLTLCLVNGGRQFLLQTEPVVAQGLLDTLRPERLFAQKQFQFVGGDYVTVIPSESIEKIELRSDPVPDWPYRETVLSVQEVSEEEFQRIRRREIPTHTNALGQIVTVQVAQIGLAVELRSGATIYLRLRLRRTTDTDSEMNPPTVDDVRFFLQHLFSQPVLFGELEDNQGVFLINPANAVRFTITPPPPAPLLGAWVMQSVNQ